MLLSASGCRLKLWFQRVLSIWNLKQTHTGHSLQHLMEWQHFACRVRYQLINGEGMKDNGYSVFILKYHILFLFWNANTEGRIKNNNKKALYFPRSSCCFFHCKADLLVFCQVPWAFHIQAIKTRWLEVLGRMGKGVGNKMRVCIYLSKMWNLQILKQNQPRIKT